MQGTPWWNAPFADLVCEQTLISHLHQARLYQSICANTAAKPQAATKPLWPSLACLGRVSLAAVAAIALLGLQPEQAPPALTGATSFRLPDGRALAYHVRGGRDGARHTAFWLHGIISSRYSSPCLLPAVPTCAFCWHVGYWHARHTLGRWMHADA